ncbi:hypothetical protein GCM10025762_20070 [Haloechinothrix salitolerans]
MLGQPDLVPARLGKRKVGDGELKTAYLLQLRAHNFLSIISTRAPATARVELRDYGNKGDAARATGSGN